VLPLGRNAWPLPAVRLVVLVADPLGYARIETVHDGVLVHVATDEAQARDAVAREGVPVIKELGVGIDDLLLLVFWGGIHEETVLGDADLLACLLEDVAHVRVLAYPEHALAADDVVWPGLDELGQPVDVERLATLVDEGGDVVLEHLGVLVLLGVRHGVGPCGRVVGRLKAEASGIEKLAHGHVAVLGLDDHRIFLQASNNGLELLDLRGRDPVGLVEDDRGAELDLLDDKALDVILVDVIGEKVLAAVELVPHACAIDHGDDVIEVKRGLPIVLCLVAVGRDGVGDRDGLADARGLDDDVVEVAGVRDALELFCQVIGKRAADAAIGERDEVVGLGETAVPDETGVHVDLADVVDDDGGTDALVIAEDVVQKRGLSRAKIAGE